MADETQASDPVSDAAVEWFAKLRDSETTDEDRAEFGRWRDADPAHGQAYAEIEALWIELDELPPPEAAGDMIEEPGPRVPSRWRPGIPIAAAFTLTLAVGWTVLPVGGFSALMADERTGTAELRRLTLPDGSEAVLDAGSALSVDVTAQERRITLVSGSAFFRVKHEPVRPFVVVAGNGEVRDIGTAFEVTRGPADTRVAVAEGAVVVSLDSGGSATLREGQRVAYGKTLGRAHTMSTADIAAWRGGRLVFVDAPLAEVLATLERHGARRPILFDRALAARRLTGAFDMRRPDEAMAAAAERAGASVSTFGPIAYIR